MNRKKNLLITFDALGTIYRPRRPIAVQYGEVAADLGFPPVAEMDLHRSFRIAYEQSQKEHPNYGKLHGMQVNAWWEKVIGDTFKPFISTTRSLPPRLVPELIARFSTAEGYALYEDARAILNDVRNRREMGHCSSWETVVVGVISNSDNRVPGILRSLGLSVRDAQCSSTQDLERGKGSLIDDLDGSSQLDFVVLSYDADAEKPDPRIFERAEEIAAQLSGRDHVQDFVRVHVGDDLKKDVVGASNAFWSSVLIDRDGTFAEEMARNKTKVLEKDLVLLQSPLEERSRRYRVIQDLRHLPLCYEPGLHL